jgi:hypothetical protein
MYTPQRLGRTAETDDEHDSKPTLPGTNTPQELRRTLEDPTAGTTTTSTLPDLSRQIDKLFAWHHQHYGSGPVTKHKRTKRAPLKRRCR